ncbi:ABC transporter ATP-binding protein [Saccharicrinis fermentans]|uniref:Lipid A export ATP-binding/permease protein MsbA n=1 Tax=Saccharicrinis fermentans DSM 9555 = JCM 21142 TaxID=869213 RepID=W7YJH3_9BACT|nr:ABC transporter ATP-binding protein [Saccharicrinis fermentans]GAF04666.1 lipid A export ATP-binding/permease protein MsbA [Saccharicrinis fermentans DSM 9555 = JCM 21142]
MIRFFQHKYALSKDGAKDLQTAILWHTLLNLSFMLPIVLAFAFLDDYIKHWKTGDSLTRDVWFYVIFAAISFAVMYIIAFIDYAKTYTKVYNEGASRRIKLAETLRKLPMSFFGKKDISDLSSTIMDDATQIEQLFSHSIPQLFASLASLFIMSIAMFIYNWQMSLAMFWVVPVGFLVFSLSKKLQSKGHQVIYNQKRIVSDTIQDGMDMVQEIKSYNKENEYLQDLNTELDSYESNLVKYELVGGALLNLSHFTLKLGFPSVIFAGAFLLAGGTISLFTYLVFLIIVGRIYDPFIETMNNFAILLYLNVRIKRMKEMDNMPRQTGRSKFAPANYDIEFRNVDFSYKEGQQTLRNVSFIAKQGEITALVGPSGGGKSTCAKLTARFWDIDKGSITIGGKDISLIEPEIILKKFAIVFQDVALFNNTVMENIRLGRKNATDDEVKKVAKLAQCHEFIENLPNKYNTIIGENGETLSGGERQRISIARALLKDAPIVLLDEATASLDVENETKIQTGISELVKNKTVLIIAHRMRTVANADKVVVLSEGSVVENGAPDKLKQHKGVFAKMVERQMTVSAF